MCCYCPRGLEPYPYLYTLWATTTPSKNWPLYHRMDCLLNDCIFQKIDFYAETLTLSPCNWLSVCFVTGWTLGVSLWWSILLSLWVSECKLHCSFCWQFPIRNTLPLLPSLCCIVPCCLYPFFLYDVNSKNDLKKNGWWPFVWILLIHRRRVLILWVWWYGDFYNLGTFSRFGFKDRIDSL